MLFCTGEYVLFLAAVVTVYWLTPWPRVRVWILVGASYYFYYRFNQWLALVVATSSVMDYLIARGMDATGRPGRRKLLLIASLCMNLGLLCYFKYVNFFIESYFQALDIAYDREKDLLKIILPIGISFYTFEAINYTVDVYRRKIRAERNLDHFLLFILFFPHLVAGPIVRAADFLPQVKKIKHWDWSRVGLGVGLLVLGAFKKLAIADRMALFVDPVFKNVGDYSSSASWTAAVAFALQVYCDFSGYSDMALGAAHLFGFKLVINFKMPFLSANITEFWRRWHISLSTWLRDYLFIPLGGSRHGDFKTNRNLLITMTLAGLWHGANWPMVMWGFLMGVWQVAHRLATQALRPFPGVRAVLSSPPGWVLRVAITFAVFCITLAVFRSPSLHAGGVMLTKMFVPTPGKPAPLHMQAFWVTVLIVIAGHAIGWYLTRSPMVWKRAWQLTPAPALGVVGAAVLLFAIVLSPGATKAFIYFQF
ncbi:MAG TPA: MBOAT family O-acyltransferase [Gemmataceae bacterium]|jgi:alginate O-acetyltransferase complex protein AlgI|nr:MBOAT family O-acyltransferase [Gemmataceae bacterium]